MSSRLDSIAVRASDMRRSEPGTLDLVRTDFEFLPNEYLQFLIRVGWGELAGFMFYSGPLALDEVFDQETVEASAEIILIGDDMAGGHLGYVKVGSEWSLTEFDHTELPGSPAPSNLSLADFIESTLLVVQ